MKLPDRFKKRLGMTIAGVMICAVAVGFFKCSLFGVDPFQCFAQGIWGHFFDGTLSYGTYYAIFSVLFLVVDLILDKHYIGIATFINMFVTGYVVDFTVCMVSRVCPEPVLGQRILYLIVGVLLMCFASSLYMTSDLGVSVYDAIPIIISNRTKLSFKFARITTDIICVVIGTISGLMPGIGTIITAFFMGPLVDFFNRKFSRPFLEKS